MLTTADYIACESTVHITLLGPSFLWGKRGLNRYIINSLLLPPQLSFEAITICYMHNCVVLSSYPPRFNDYAYAITELTLP